jgi:hypothetical protein
MPADLHKSLEECEVSAQALIKEMGQYKAARELNQKAADSLERTTAALSDVIRAIRPFTEKRLKIFILIQTVAWSLTTLIVVGLLVMVILWKLR